MNERRTFSCAAIVLTVIVCLGCPAPAHSAPPAPGKAAPQGKVSLLGTRFGPDMPKGYEEVGGGVISDENHRMTQFAIQLVRKGDEEMVWLSRVTGADPSGRLSYQILDVLVLPQRKRGEIVTWLACCFGGKRNDSIIAYTDKYYYRVLRAWIANRKTGRIEEVSTRGIVCQDPATILQ